jgi:uncharacterized protein involved in response to NO
MEKSQPASMAPRDRATSLQAHRVLFPAAALYGAVIAPLWLLLLAGALPWADRLPPGWHGHEMLFGFAMAVIGGYLLTRTKGAWVWAAFGAWLAGRLAFWGIALPQPVAFLLSLLFPALLFWQAGLPFLRAVKRGRNVIFAPLIGAFALAELLYQVGAAGLWDAGLDRASVLAIDLITLLMVVMGGRVIAAATSGAIQRRGGYVRNMAQIRVEGVVAILLVLVLLLDLAGVAGVAPAALRLAAAVLILTRMARWRVWRVAGDPAVSVLHLGYLWLAAGLAAAAVMPLWLGVSLQTALHGTTVGALGTLACAMMVRTVLQRARKPVVPSAAMTSITVAVSCSALLRLAYEGTGAAWMLSASAVVWSACFLVLFVFTLKES